MLETSTVLGSLLFELDSLPGYEWHEVGNMREFLTDICYESKAIDTLFYNCVEMSSENSPALLEERTAVASALHTLGTAIFEQLQALRAYRAGYLYYQFSNWLAGDMVLQRFEIDQDPNV